MEIGVTVETVYSFGGGFAPADYTNTKAGIAFRDQWSQANDASGVINFCPFINSLSAAEVPVLMEHLDIIRAGTGMPDARATPGYNNFEGLDSAVRDYRGRLACCTLATISVLVTKANYTPAQVIDFEQNHKTTHLGWDTYHTASGRTWTDLLNAIDNDPAWHTACPTRYASCAV